MRARHTSVARRMTSVVAILAVIFALVSVNAASAGARAPLRGHTTYEFVGDVFDAEKGVLVWEGSIEGDFEGCIQWWALDFPTNTGQASHYDNTWEIWDSCDPDAVLLLSGTESGSTTVRHFQNTIWRTNGVVTGPADSDLVGRRMHDQGTIEWDFTGEIPAPMSGIGEFRVN